MVNFVLSADKKSGVIYNPKRKHRRVDIRKTGCPFCLGNEELTPPEIQDWPVRVFPNKYKILTNHYIIIHSPNHCRDIADLAFKQVTLLIKAYALMHQKLSKYGKVIIFNNSAGKAGASMIHPHSQVIAVPHKIRIEVPPIEPVANIVLENDDFVAYCPEFSQFPYEIWIAPKTKNGFFANFYEKKSNNLAKILQLSLKKLRHVLNHNHQGKIPYNFYLISGKKGYLRITPRIKIPAGFEFATGIFVNATPPAEAAAKFREAEEI